MLRIYLRKGFGLKVKAGPSVQPADMLNYLEELKRWPNAEIGFKNFFEMISGIFLSPFGWIRKALLLAVLISLGSFWGGVAIATTSPERPSHGGEDRVAEIIVDINDPWKTGPEWHHMARSLIYLKEGERFAAERLETSLRALKLSGKFRHIGVETEQVSQGMRLIFTLKPFHLIKQFYVEDNYPVFESDIRKVMTVRVGDVYDADTIEKQKTIIASLYRQRGFIDPIVRMDAIQDKADGNYTVRIRVEKGAYYTLKRLTIHGNHAFSEQTLQQQMKIWRRHVFSGQIYRFSPRVLEADIKKLVAFYRGRKYPQIQIEQTVEKQPHAKNVLVTLTINEGPRYEVRYQGNEAFSDFSLRKHNVIFSSGNIRDAGLRKTVRNLRRHYRENGFLDATVTWAEETASDAPTAVRRIRIDIHEGVQTKVASVQIEGNRSFDDKRIRKQMLSRPPGLFGKTPYVPETLDEDIFVIKSLYAAAGFLDASVTSQVELSPDKTLARIMLHIQEGVQTRVTSLAFVGEVPLEASKLRQNLMLTVGGPFNASDMQSDTDTLSVLVSEAGYPHVQVTAATEFSDDRTGVNIRYVIDPGRFVTMGEIFYTGNFRTKPRVIDRVHGLTPGEPFSLKRSLEAPKKIRDMGIFDSVQLVTIGLREQTETVNFIADLEEKKPYFFEVGLGYQSDRGVYGRSKVGDRNLWGLNKDAWIGGEVSETGYKAETALREPRLWGTRIEMTVSAFAEKIQAFNQTFGTRIIGTAVNLTRPLTDRLDVGLGFRYEQREQFGVAQTQVQGVTTERRSNLVTSPFITYDARDSFVRPQEGIFSEFKIDLSKGVQNATDDFTKYRLDLRSFTSPLKRLTLAVMGRAGTIRPYGDNSIIPADQRFYLGGMNTVRGYDENLLFFDANGDPVGGNSALNGSIEGRIGIGYNFELTTFFDTGSVIQDPNFSGAGFRSSFGFGLLYQTAIGPIGVMYGWKIDPRPEESPGQWHFTIGYTF